MKISPSTIIQRSVETLTRTWVTTVPTVLVMAMVMTMFHGLLLVHEQAQKTLENISQKFSITVYLKDSADPFEIGNFMTALQQRSDIIKGVSYTSQEEAWKLMSKTFSLDNDLLKKYRFSLPASLTIIPRSPSDTDAVTRLVQAQGAPLLKESTADDKQKKITNQMVEFINGVKDSTLRIVLFFIALFIVGGTLLMSSTIHLAITSRHREISIMKLVGASYSSITLPFVAEGALIGLLAFVVHLGLLLFLPFEQTTAAPSTFFAELIVLVFLAAAVSYVTTLFHLKKSLS